MIGLNRTANVYGRGVSGTHDQLVRANLPVRLSHISSGDTASVTERSQFSTLRRLLWGADYVIPEHSEVEVEGVRWAVVDNTVSALNGPSGLVMYRRCDLVGTDGNAS